MGKRQRARSRRAGEAVDDSTSFDDIRALVATAVQSAYPNPGGFGTWVMDLADDWVVYEVGDGDGGALWRATYTIDDADKVTLGAPEKVQRVTSYEKAQEAIERIPGRVLEAKGTDDSGGRIYGVEILRFGASKNRRIYPAGVMTEAVDLYEGAKAFDHHRTEAELRSSTVEGLIGTYLDVRATTEAITGDLHLLPSATRVAEAFDASLANQERGLDPLIGISHDVHGNFRPVLIGGNRYEEAVQISSVNSADVVADPSAGGRVTRMVAGGIGDDNEGNPMDLKQLLAQLRDADSAKRAELLKEHKAILDAAGLTTDDVTKMLTTDVPDAEAVAAKAKADQEAAAAADAQAKADAEAVKEKELVGAGAGTQATEATFSKSKPTGRRLIRDYVEDAELNPRMTESIERALGDSFTEVELERVVETAKNFASEFERANLMPTVKHLRVTEETVDKKKAALDAFFDGRYTEGYRSLKQAYRDITGQTDVMTLDDAELPFMLVREAREFRKEGTRATESADTTTFSHILGDSITRKMVADYNLPQLQDWRKIVSSIVPVTDFRTQRRDRMGGYGVLPAVAQGAPYQPLTTPADEEVTYAATKRGGTEDLTLEMIANDDIGAVRRIPTALGRAAAQTLYRFVFNDLFASNPTIYDSVALFHATHANTTATVPLSYSSASTLRQKLRAQAAYGNSVEILGLTPRFLVIPNSLEHQAWELTKSDKAPPATSPGASDVANLHQGYELIIVDFLTDVDDWFMVADPAMCPTIELGFYGGNQNPELFVQSDPTVGSNFDADKTTYKIRHIYSGAVLDYRAFQRATN